MGPATLSHFLSQTTVICQKVLGKNSKGICSREGGRGDKDLVTQLKLQPVKDRVVRPFAVLCLSFPSVSTD